MNLQRALAYSRYAGRALAAFPELASDLETAAAHAFDWTAPAASVAAAAGATELASTLRTLRRRVFLHTMARDLTGRAGLTEVCATLTTLAEVSLQAAVAVHASQLNAAHGAPIGTETGTAVGAHSEVGQLRTVMVHRPDLAHERLSPSNCHELLFDDVIWVRRASAEPRSCSSTSC